jgi:hypothetical protein
MRGDAMHGRLPILGPKNMNSTASSSSQSASPFVPWKHGPTLVALFAALVLRPAVYTTVDPGVVIQALAGSNRRAAWWMFHGWILLLQWIPFFIAWWALARSGRSWFDYGIDWFWFRRRKASAIVCAGAFGLVAVGAPWWWYHGNPPPESRTFALLPVTAMERLFFPFASVSAGICEETCYRGLPLRGVADSVSAAIWVLPVTIVSFVFIHGWFGLQHFGIYASIGLAFGAGFILLGCRRLEYLIVVHALIDAACIVAP